MARIRRVQQRNGITDIIFRDALFNGLGAFMFLTVILLAVANVAGNDKKRAADAPGNVTVEIYWPQELDTDVDLWVRGPDKMSVGYSNKGGVVFNLLRDDLGHVTPDDPVNYEVTYSRGIFPGETCVNLHLYSNRSGIYPIPVKVNVTVTKGDPGSNAAKGADAPLLTTNVNLKAVGQELNVFCFFTDEQGNLLDKKTYTSQGIRLRSPGK